jgi:hypothetical protein
MAFGVRLLSMDNKRNVATFDYASNPALKSLFDSWNVGETYTLSVKFQLNEKTDQGATATIQEITSEEPEAEEPTTITPDNDHPVLAVMSGGEKEPYVAP